MHCHILPNTEVRLNTGVRSCIATFYPAERAAAPLHDDVAHVPAARDPAACERERLC